eukprot:Skav236226  [mRNA]  locus=scaffold132:191361:289207:+ [translate_table: standard]
MAGRAPGPMGSPTQSYATNAGNTFRQVASELANELVSQLTQEAITRNDLSRFPEHTREVTAMYQEVLALRSELQRVAELMQGYMQRERQLHDTWFGGQASSSASALDYAKKHPLSQSMKRNGSSSSSSESGAEGEEGGGWAHTPPARPRLSVDNPSSTSEASDSKVLLCAEEYDTKSNKTQVDEKDKKRMFRAISSSSVTLRHLVLRNVSMGPSAQQMLAELHLSRAAVGAEWERFIHAGLVPCGHDGKSALQQLGQALSSRRALQHLNLAAAARRQNELLRILIMTAPGTAVYESCAEGTGHLNETCRKMNSGHYELDLNSPYDRSLLRMLYKKCDRIGGDCQSWSWCKGGCSYDVLQAMPNGGESWTAEDVDQLLAQADSSGDGQLQIQEFLKWIFAEDKEISKGAPEQMETRERGAAGPTFFGRVQDSNVEAYRPESVIQKEWPWLSHEVTTSYDVNVRWITEVPSPQLALWMDETNGGKIDVVAVDTDGLLGSSRKWNRVSLFGEPRWLRALALHPSPVLFADVEPADACSYSALNAGFQPVAWHHLTGCKEFFRYKSTYKVAVRWVVDSTEGLPVYSDTGLALAGTGVSAKKWSCAARTSSPPLQGQEADEEVGREGWLCYYSNGKRVAKRNLESGALRFNAYRVSIDPTQAHKGTWKINGQCGLVRNVDDPFEDPPWFVYPEELWKQIVEYDKGNYLMASTATHCKREVDCGMVHGHAYSLLHAVEVDGTFWMDYEDWQFIMGQMNVMNHQMPSTRGDFYKQLVEADDSPEVDDPQPAIDVHDADLVHDVDEADESTVTFQNVPSIVWLQKGKTGMLPLDEMLPKRGWDQEPADGFQTSDGKDFLRSEGLTMYEGRIQFSVWLDRYIWAQDEYNAGVDDLLKADAWACEKAEGFQRSDGKALSLWSKHFVTGPASKQKATGPVGHSKMAPHTGDRDYIFENVPACLAGGLYIGSRTWPKAGTWTIEYEAPTMLYVWIETAKYDAGVSAFLKGDGWSQESTENFQRRQEKGTNPLALMAPSVKSFLRVLDSVKKLLAFTPENPTGHYYLDLANPADFAVAEQILVLNQWEILGRPRLRAQEDFRALCAVDLDLTVHDQRRAVSILWTLAEKERMENLLLSIAEWSPPASWAAIENVTYKGGKETLSFSTRKKLAEVNWWSSLSEAPVEAQQPFLGPEGGRPRHDHGAFSFIDGAKGNGVINLKEMTEPPLSVDDRVQRMGYKEFQGHVAQGVLAEFLDVEQKAGGTQQSGMPHATLRQGQSLPEFWRAGGRCQEWDVESATGQESRKPKEINDATSHFHAAHSQFNDHAKNTTMSHQQQRQALVDPMRDTEMELQRINALLAQQPIPPPETSFSGSLGRFPGASMTAMPNRSQRPVANPVAWKTREILWNAVLVGSSVEYLRV